MIIVQFMLYNLLIRMLNWAARLPRRYKQFFVFTVDLLLLGVAILIAYSIRMGVWAVWNEAIWKFAIGAYAAMVPIFLFAGVYRTIFRFAGVGMMRTIARAFVLYGAVLTIIYMLIGFPPVPRTLADSAMVSQMVSAYLKWDSLAITISIAMDV